MPIPDLSNKPGPGRPGWGPTGTYDFQFEVTGAVTIKANAAASGSFRVSWPSGHVDILSGNNASIAAPDATAGIVSINNEELDTTYMDEFAIVSGQANVSKVISWGSNAWGTMSQAFNGCTSLSDISTTKFIASSGANIVKMFNGCTSLLEADIRNWDLTAGVNWSSGSPFGGLANLQKLDMTGMNIKLTVRSDNAFTGIGTAVANGCEFLMSNINWSTSTDTYTPYWFSSTKLNPNSNLSGWIFPSAGWSGLGMFNSADMTGTNSTLNLSGWSTYSGSQLPQFNSFNDPAGDTGLKIDMSNMGMSNVTDMSSMFYYSDISEVIGLSTWGATAGNVNMTGMFNGCSHMKFYDSDNFTSTFINSLTPTNVSLAFYSSGAALTSGYGVAPNITNIDLSNCTNFHQFFSGIRCTNVPALNTATFPSTAISLTNLFTAARFISSSETHVDFSNVTVKLANTTQMFNGTWVDKVTFGNNVDFSAVTTVNNMHYYMNNLNPDGTTTELTYPTNADFSSLTTTGNWFAGVQSPTTGPLTTCQIDNLIRRFRATAYGSALNVNFYQSQITEAPSVVQAQEAELVANGWTITENSTDATLPFAYASYAVDPTGITTISPTTTPPAGSVFTATNSLSINSSTGVITINTFRGSSTIRCTYPDGCYNEVAMVLQVPFQVDVTINSSTSYVWGFNPQMSAGECLVDWGDSSSETVTGNITHTYANTGGDATYSVKIFDAPSGSKFTGFNAWNNTYINNGGNLIDIKKWGDIQWQNNTWFSNDLNISPYYLQLQVSCASNDAPDLSQVTSLNSMFRVGSNRFNYAFTDPNNSLASWNVSTITDMAYMFAGIGKNGSVTDNGNFDTNLNSWDVSNVTDMSSLAALTRGYSQHRVDFFCDQWDVSKVESFNRAFYSNGGGTAVNRDLSNWNTSSATDMAQMFYNNTPGPNTNLLYKVVNAGQASEYKAWDVSNVTSFASMFYGGKLGTQGIYNWKINSTAGVNVNMASMFQTCPDLDAFVQTDADHINTKQETVGSETYTAWNMSRVSSLSNFNYNGYTTPYNPDLSGWSLGNVTTMSSMFYDSNPYIANPVLNRDISNWKPISVTNMTNFYRNAQKSPIAMDRSNYDLLLDIANGWGSVASSMQSGVAFDMGTSQYSPGNIVSVTWNANNSSSGTNTLKTSGFNLQAATSVGDIIYYPASVGTTTTAYARITGYNSTDEATTTTTNWPTSAGSARSFQIYDSNAAKGRFALLEAGWTITDGGAYIPFDSAEFTITTIGANEVFKIWNHGMNAKIDWGDGNGFINDPNTGSPYTSTAPQFTYTTQGTYTIKIMEAVGETFNGFRFGFGYQYGDQSGKRVQSLVNWGTSPVTSFSQAFDRSENLTTLPVDGSGYAATPSFASATSMASAFKETGLTTIDVRNWNPSTAASVSDISNMFGGIAGFVGNGLDQWDVSSVTNMGGFVGGNTANTVFNVDITGWDTRNVTNFSYIFKNARAFNQNIANWRTESGTNLSGMFMGAYAFNQDINTKVVGSGASAYIAWDTSNNQNWNGMFMDAQAFNTSIDKWEIAQVSSNQGMTFMFGKTSVFNQDLLTKDVTIGAGTPVAKTYVAWDVSYIQTFGIQYNSPGAPAFHGMFESNTVFNGDISNWDIPSTNARSDGKIFNRMFASATAFNKDLSQKTITNVTGKGSYEAWDVSSATQLNATFNTASSFDQNLSNWTLNISATNFDNLFRSTNLSQNNYTDTIVGWANYVKNQTPDAPLEVSMANQYGRNFESARSGGANFANAAAARTFLTTPVASGGAGWTINGDIVIPLPFSPLKFKVNIQTTTTTANLDFKIPYVNGTNFTINWGDTNIDTNLSATNSSITHQYSTAGTYTIEVGAASSYPTRLGFSNFGGNPNTIADNGALAVTEITQWGSIPWSYVESMWDGCTNLDIMSATDTPDFSQLVSHAGSFPSGGLTRFLGGSTGTAWQAMRGPSLGTVNASINTWDVSSVRDFSSCFAGGGTTSAFNTSINNWDISGVTKSSGLAGMFAGCLKFNQPLSNWTLPSSVTSLNSFLFGCEDFNQDISNFSMTNITDIGSMFYGCDDFNATNLENWERTTAGNTSTMANVTNMSNLFNYKKDVNKTFNNAISSWNTSGVTTMANLSANVTGNGQGMTSAFITGWDTSSVSNFSSAFKNTYDFNSNLGSLNISSLTNGRDLFYTWASGQSTANYTDTIVGWANFVKNQTPDAPLNVDMANQNGRTFDGSRSGGANFTNATAARTFLTDTVASGGAGWTINGDAIFLPFQMQFEVSSGVSKTITIPNTVGSSYTVNWGDGTTTTESAGNISHTYDGSYPNPTVSIGASSDTGPFTTFSFANTGSKSDLLDVPQWGSIVFSTFINMFSGCNNANFQISATDAPTISSTGNPVMSYMFRSPSTFNSDISHWDVSNIDGGIAYYSFQAWLQNNSSFNQNLSSWDIQTTSCLQFWSRAFGMSTENFTDTIVGWAVKVYKNSGLYDVDMSTANGVTFDCSRTSDNASGQTYAAKYGSDWPSNPAGENWTNAGDAFDYLTGTTANWSITQFASQNC